MMGTGKTTVGALVAEEISRPFADLDTEILGVRARSVATSVGAGDHGGQHLAAGA